MENNFDDAHAAPGVSADDFSGKHGAQMPGSGQALPGDTPGTDGSAGNLGDFDIGVVTRSVERIFRTIDGKLTRHIYTKARNITGNEAVASDFANEAGMVDEELELIAELTTAVASQYSLVGKHTPLTLLGITVAGYGLRMATVLNKLDALEARANKRRETNEQGTVGSGEAGREN